MATIGTALGVNANYLSYSGGMTAQPEHGPPSAPEMPEKDLRAIRAALVTPQDLEAFDASLKVVLDRVRVTLDISPLNEFLHTWWLIACGSVKDPEGQRRLHQEAAKILAGERPPEGRPWREVIADRRRVIEAGG